MIIATPAFLAVEHPGIALGRRLGRLAVRKRQAPPRAASSPSDARHIPVAGAMRYGAGGTQGAWIVDDE